MTAWWLRLGCLGCKRRSRDEVSAEILPFPDKSRRNAHGLSRYIKADVKREVRRACGFGCVICGVTITDYEHFFPDFRDAHSHDPSQIALLCPTHHREATNGILPKAQIAESRAKPAALQSGFARKDHPYFRGRPSIFMGSIRLQCRAPLRVHGFEPIRVSYDDEDGIALLSGYFSTPNGKSILKIQENWWDVSSDNWDFENVGNRYVFRGPEGDRILELEFRAPDSLIIKHLDTHINGVRVEVRGEHLMFMGMVLSASSFTGSDVGICIG